MNHDYIIVRGPIGVGKTTIAKNLVRMMRENGQSCSYFSIDDCCLNLVGGPYSFEKKSLVFHILTPLLQELISQKYTPVIEGLLNKQQCNELKNLIQGNPLYITLVASLEQCIARDSIREGYKKRGVERVTTTWNWLNTECIENEHIIDNSFTTEEVVREIYSLKNKK